MSCSTEKRGPAGERQDQQGLKPALILRSTRPWKGRSFTVPRRSALQGRAHMVVKAQVMGHLLLLRRLSLPIGHAVTA